MVVGLVFEWKAYKYNAADVSHGVMLSVSKWDNFAYLRKCGLGGWGCFLIGRPTNVMLMMFFLTFGLFNQI